MCEKKYKKQPYVKNYDKKQMYSDIETKRRLFKLPCLVCKTYNVCKSHSISHSYVLNKLSLNNHVLMPLRDKKTSPHICMRLMGIHDATTFQCLCEWHDSSIFIDISILDQTTKSFFLLNYRCLINLYYKFNRERNLNKSIGIKYDLSKNKRLKAWVKSLDFHYNNVVQPKLDKLRFLYSQSYFDNFTTYTYEIPYKTGIACSSIINFEHNHLGIKFKYDILNPSICFLHILPQNDKTLIILSCENDDIITKQIINHLTANLVGADLIKYLNTAIPLCTEDFVISPKLYNSWTEIEKQNLEDMLNLNYYGSINNKLAKKLYCSYRAYNLFKELN